MKMRKVVNWMLAAILVCGSCVVMSSCGDDEKSDNNDGKQLTANTYEVTLSAVLPESAAAFFTLDLEYTGADGNVSKATVKAGDQSDAMSDKMKKLYDERKAFVLTLGGWADNKEKWALFDQLIVKNFTFVVPAGKSFSYKATTRVRTDFTQPSGETFPFIEPFVYLGSKRISGNSQDNSIFTERLGLSAQDAVETENLAAFIEMYDGKVIAEDARTMN
jgi:hypothetical protein